MTLSTSVHTLRYSHTVGLYQMAGRGFSHPVDLALGPGGAIFVLNRGNPTQAVVALRVSVTTIDEQDLGIFTGYGREDGRLIWPTSIAIDQQGRIYISDEHRHDVQVFDKDRAYSHKWGQFGSAPGQLNRPSGLAIDPAGNVVVVDHLNNRIQTFTPDGQLLSCWGEAGSGPAQFNLPWGVTVDEQGVLYVADWGNDRIQKLTADGQHLASYGSSGRGEGQLWRPSGVAVGPDGNVYVADRGNDRLQAYSATGESLGSYRGESGLSRWAEIWLEGNPDVAAKRAEISLEPEKTFWAPTAVDVDEAGRILVLDTCRHRIQVYVSAD